MSILQKLKNEIKAVVLAALYFGVWIGMLVVLKKLLLAEYEIQFNGLSMALVGALVLAKVVLVLEHVPLGSWGHTKPALVIVILRTALYSFGVFIVLLIEKGFEGRHQYGGFFRSLITVLQHEDAPHVWANTIGLSAALLGYNMLSVVRQYLGEGGLIRLFMTPLQEEPKARPPSALERSEAGEQGKTAGDGDANNCR